MKIWKTAKWFAWWFAARWSNVTLHEATIDLIERFIDIKTVSLITWQGLKKEANMVKEVSDENGKS